MKALLKLVSQALLLVPGMAMSFLMMAPAAVHAATTPPGTAPTSVTCNDTVLSVSSGADCAAPANAQNSLFGPGGVFVTIVNLLIFIIGAIAVLMLIVGGIRYVVSNGEQSAVTSAKNTILYAIIGIIVAFLAYGAVSFVTARLS